MNRSGVLWAAGIAALLPALATVWVGPSWGQVDMGWGGSETRWGQRYAPWGRPYMGGDQSYHTGPDGGTQAMAPRQQGGVRLGPLVVHGGVTVTETFTDNFFLDPEHERSEWITTVAPNLAVHLPVGRHSVDLDYRSDFDLLAHRSQFDMDRHMVHPRFTLDFPGGLTVRVGNRWSVLANPPVDRFDEVKRYYNNITTVDMTYQFSDRYSVSAVYSHTLTRFDKNRFEVDDSDQDGAAVNLNYRILPKTSIFLEVGWVGTDYPHRDLFSTDNDVYRVWLGVRTKPTAKVVGSLKGGWSYKAFDDGRAGDDVSTWGIQGDLYYDLTAKTRLSLTIFRRIEDTAFTTTQNVAFGSSYNSSGGILEARQFFTPRLSTYANVGLIHDRYNDEGLFGDKRRDRMVFAGLGVDYRLFNCLALGASYRYANNESNFDAEDYAENRIMFYAALGF
jgi:hypothetical protein